MASACNKDGPMRVVNARSVRGARRWSGCPCKRDGPAPAVDTTGLGLPLVQTVNLAATETVRCGARGHIAITKLEEAVFWALQRGRPSAGRGHASLTEPDVLHRTDPATETARCRPWAPAADRHRPPRERFPATETAWCGL